MLVRSRCMKPSAAGRAAVWTAAVSVSAVAPHAAPVALGAAVAKEAFDLLRARSQRISVLAYLQAAGAGTYLDIGPCPAAPALVLSVASPGSRRLDDEEGAASVPADELPPIESGPDPGDFCVKQRADWLAYAMTRTRSWPDAEDAVSHVVQKIFEHHDEHGTLCPDMRDPVGWSKTVIRNYLIDRYRRSRARHKRSGAFVLAGEDIADGVTDQIIARKALAFRSISRSPDPHDRRAALGRWPGAEADR